MRGKVIRFSPLGRNLTRRGTGNFSSPPNVRIWQCKICLWLENPITFAIASFSYFATQISSRYWRLFRIFKTNPSPDVFRDKKYVSSLGRNITWRGAVNCSSSPNMRSWQFKLRLRLGNPVTFEIVSFFRIAQPKLHRAIPRIKQKCNTPFVFLKKSNTFSTTCAKTLRADESATALDQNHTDEFGIVSCVGGCEIPLLRTSSPLIGFSFRIASP